MKRRYFIEGIHAIMVTYEGHNMTSIDRYNRSKRGFTQDLTELKETSMSEEGAREIQEAEFWEYCAYLRSEIVN